MEQKLSTKDKILMGITVLGIVLIILFIFKNKSGSNLQISNRVTGFQGEITMQELARDTQCVLPTDNNFDAFAQCLTQKGAVMYGAEWCPHCKEQKAAFGASFKYIKYVECPENTQLCIDDGIQGYPTWLINPGVINSTSTKI